MTALREQILARAAQALTDGGVANVFRSREIAITRGIVPATVVLFDGEETQRAGGASDRHDMTMLLVHFVRGDPWDQLASAQDEQVHSIVMADPGLAGLISGIFRQGASPDAQEADRTAGALNVRYRISYLTSAAHIGRPPI